METHSGLSRVALLERLSQVPNFSILNELSDAELLAQYCEVLVAIAPDPKKD
jgi:hypothetical protein